MSIYASSLWCAGNVLTSNGSTLLIADCKTSIPI